MLLQRLDTLAHQELAISPRRCTIVFQRCLLEGKPPAPAPPRFPQTTALLPPAGHMRQREVMPLITNQGGARPFRSTTFQQRNAMLLVSTVCRTASR